MVEGLLYQEECFPAHKIILTFFYKKGKILDTHIKNSYICKCIFEKHIFFTKLAMLRIWLSSWLYSLMPYHSSQNAQELMLLVIK